MPPQQRNRLLPVCVEIFSVKVRSITEELSSTVIYAQMSLIKLHKKTAPARLLSIYMQRADKRERKGLKDSLRFAGTPGVCVER